MTSSGKVFSLAEEMRDDFLVTEKRKKIWKVELELLERLDEVCQKYHLKYFFDYGSLLGAVRHQGFIPWDDDLDVTMMRDDYQKLLEIAGQEFKEPYFFQTSYTDGVIMTFAKLRDSRTTAIEFPERKEMNQGIFIDIFPLDDVPDGEPSRNVIYQVQKEMWECIYFPEEMRKRISEKNATTVLDKELLLEFIEVDDKAVLAEYEKFCLNHFGSSKNINYLCQSYAEYPPLKREWYQDVKYLPFEHIMVPVPCGYENILSANYGDWKTPVMGTGAHTITKFDTEKSYRNYIS